MISHRWTLCLLLGVPAVVLILLNWMSMISAVKDRRSYSFAPPWLCGVTGAVACLLCPVSQVQHLALSPLVLDPSISIMVMGRLSVVLGRLRARH